MLKTKTTFIIGAGASFDLGFPLGDGLRTQIVQLLATEDPKVRIGFKDTVLTQLLQRRASQEVGYNCWPDRMECYRHAATIIQNGLPFARSIDSFLDGLRNEPDVAFLGKLAIGTLILRAEASSPMTHEAVRAANADQIRSERLGKVVGGWHALLGQILYEGHTRETVDSIFERASFVIFNYDRCIEEFLTISVMRRFAVSRSRALIAVSKCRIIHPYGQVGEFFDNREGYVAFGDCSEQQLLWAAENIRTFTETTEDNIAEQVKDSVGDADTIVFMGFGWLPQNMELLNAIGRGGSASKVFATTKDMQTGEVAVVADQIDRMLSGGRHSPPLPGGVMPSAEFITDMGDCKALMSNCWLRLTNA